MHLVLITHGKPHSVDAWVNATAEFLFQISDAIAAERLIEAKKLQLGIAMALMPLFVSVMEKERAALSIVVNYCDSEVSMEHAEVISVVKNMAALAGKSPWAALIASEEWQSQAVLLVSQFLTDVMHIERLWHADQNPDNASAVAYKAKFHGAS